ncbi:MAG: glutamyl-tRNA reductase [Methanolinea sp.]|nr:glutamyl-tRNA reductase [Methanolinea sp.]
MVADCSEVPGLTGRGDSALHVPVAVAGISHHTATADILEKMRFPDERVFFERARGLFAGVVLLQTCNRVEVIVHGDAGALSSFLDEAGWKGYYLYSGTQALRHLLELACGMDSMIVGEDQILGQLKTALHKAMEAGCAGPVLELCIHKAVHVGTEARRRTQINRGAVSVGSAAVQLAEERLGTLEGKHILVIGSGEMGQLVARALAAKNLTAIYVANRTYARAERLAEKVGGRAIRFDELSHYMTLSDVVISCTSAPHPVIHCDQLERVMAARCWPNEDGPRPLVIIDIAQPRDVEEDAGKIRGVSLFTIDDLREINERTMDSRRSEARKVRELIEEELVRFVKLLNSRSADEVIAALHTWAEEIRLRERDRALSRIGRADERTREIIDDLSRVLARKLLSDMTASIRLSAEGGDLGLARSLVAAITRGERLCFPREE